MTARRRSLFAPRSGFRAAGVCPRSDLRGVAVCMPIGHLRAQHLRAKHLTKALAYIRKLYKTAANAPPAKGPKTGTHE